MREIKRVSQNRRDFRANYECEGCGHIKDDVSGYDDNYFHTECVPKMKCSECGESTLSLGKVVIDKTVVPMGETR